MHHSGMLMHMRTTLNIDDSLLRNAAKLTGVKEKTSLVRLGLEALIAKESARRLANLGGTEKQILEYLDGANAELAAEVRKLMFVFDDLVRLDDRSLQRVLREVDSKDLSLAMRGTSEELQERIFRNQSTRAAQALKEEMEIGGPVRLRQVEEAQQRIVNIVRRLEDSEEIVVQRGGEDVLV